MTLRLLTLVSAITALVWAQTSVPKSKRHALLIGNTEYTSLGKAPSAVRSVELLQAALTGAGFIVTPLRNVSAVELNDVVSGKHPAILAIEPGDTCLVYYSGFAIQFKRENYALPVNYDPSTALNEIPFKAGSLNSIQQVLAERRPALRIVAIDASWDIPVGIAMTGPGLSTPEAAGTEILVALSAAPDQSIPLGTADEASPFAKVLANVIRKPGVPLIDVFTAVQREVSQTAPPQRPFVLPNVTTQFYFRDPLQETKPIVAAKHTVKRNRKDRQDYVWMRPGTFLMGCVPGDSLCEKDETPQHQVTISKGFWMGANEATVLAYQRYISEDPRTRKWPREAPADDKNRRITDRPIGGATWEEALKFCEWAGGRLPTEAEWEYVARAGKKDEIYPLTFENARDRANFYGKQGNDLFDEVANVRSFDSSSSGVWDMAGNLWEWCNDWYSETYFAQSPERDPPGPEKGSKHVIRGGSWYSDAKKHLRISIRRAGQFGNTVGFRCVLDNTEPTKALLE